MSETKWSPEPWREDVDGGIEDAKGEPVACGDDYAIDWTYWSIKPDNRRRVLACVNACAGIPTEALEAGALGKALNALVEVDRCDNSADEYRPQCPWCWAQGRGGYACSEEEEPHTPQCKRTAALRVLGRLK